MNLDFFLLEQQNFRCSAPVCRCVVSRLNYYNKNFAININRNVGVLFNSILYICKLDENTSIYDSQNFLSFDDVSTV